ALPEARGPDDRARRSQLRARAERLDDLRLDAQDPPRIAVHPVRMPIPVEQPLIGGPCGDLLPPQDDGTSHVPTGSHQASLPAASATCADDAAAEPGSSPAAGSRKVRRAE